MTSFSAPLHFQDGLDPAHQVTYSSGDIARLNSDVTISAWCYHDQSVDDEALYLSAASWSAQRAGPLLTLPSARMYVKALVEGDGVVWMLVDSYYDDELRLARVTANASLEVTVTWVATLPLSYSNYDAWLAYWNGKLIVGANGGVVPTDNIDAHVFMLEQDGTIIAQMATPIPPGVSYNLWLDAVAVNVHTDELLIVGNYYSGGYRETMFTTTLTSAGFGSWSHRGDLYYDWARWTTAVGTPGGWHILSCPNGPRYAEVIVLDGSTMTRRGSSVLHWNVSTFDDEQSAKPFDIAYEPGSGRVSYSCLAWNVGLVYAVGGVDAGGVSPTVEIIPDTSGIDWEALMRLAAMGDGRDTYHAGVTGIGRPVRLPTGPWDPFRHTLFFIAEEEDAFPTASGNQQDGDTRRAFRGMR